jgi:peptidyl-prolyl cis-trans isomerase B (cyclophilin B)
MAVTITTNHGVMTVELNTELAPLSCQNFLEYVEAGHYNGTIFHRVMNGFMIQGGGFEPGMKQKAVRKPIQNEAKNGLKNEPYTLAMARTSDPHSASCQFFINVSNNSFLDYPGQDGWGYAVFAKVVSGTEVVDAIKAVKTGRAGPHGDVPVEDVIIEKIEIV